MDLIVPKNIIANNPGKGVATLTPFQKGDFDQGRYQSEHGSTGIAIDPDSENHTLTLKGRLSGHIHETYEAHKTPPGFKADAVFQSTKVLFEVTEY